MTDRRVAFKTANLFFYSRLASQVGLVVVSLAKDASALVDTLHDLDWKRAEVTNPQLGQSESIRAGLEIVAPHDFDAVLLTPCDLPL
ncbi:MAG: NTP transferase domain-containing protein [Armatimonadota bacterium]|nr:NTP transferase domain-containing protein [Armatimonadota bacterium]